jgi:hypothetical protein
MSSGFLRCGPAFTLAISYFLGANSYSAWIIAFTPSYISWTKSLSDLPNLLLFEISNTPSSVSVCSP